MGCKPSIDQTRASSCNTEPAIEGKHYHVHQLHQVGKPEPVTRRRYTDKRPKELKNIRKIDNKLKHKRGVKGGIPSQGTQNQY